MFGLLLTPIVIQTYSSFQQSRTYTEIIDNIAMANQLNIDVGTKIESTVWNIVAGKVKFEESGIMELISDIRARMAAIRRNTLSDDNRGIMDVSLRALNTLEDYLNKLKTQIDNREPVEENEIILEEIRVCVAVINDLLQDFSSRQLMEVEVLNREWSSQSNQSFFFNIVLLIVVILVGIFAFWYISRVITNPIEKLLSMSNKISDGDFSARLELTASEEFNELALSMNAMSERIELLIEKSIEKEKQLQMLEYRAHQAQITPHFLYNTLDAIIWAAEAKDIPKVITLVSSLSSFFRISLSHGIDFISISDEVEHVKNYLTIQEIRYSDVLTYEVEVDEGLADQKMLKFLLQPLVENSLYHGIKATRERGKITVKVKKEGGKVRFIVADNGLGMEEDRLEKVRSEMTLELNQEISHDSVTKKGYGLYSVNRRLELYYGQTNGVEIKSEYKNGTEVSFVLDIL